MICRPGDTNGESLAPPDRSAEEMRSRAHAYVETVKPPANKPAKPAQMRMVLNRYLDGRTIPEISDETGISQDTASNYLNEIEHRARLRLVRRRPIGARTAGGEIRAERKRGRRRASTMDFHSLRVTWVSLALPTVKNPDPVFREHALLRIRCEARDVAHAFRPRHAANLLLRLRAFPGVNAKCEILCYFIINEQRSPSSLARDAYYFPLTIAKAIPRCGIPAPWCRM
jgi:hypothetical protein